MRAGQNHAYSRAGLANIQHDRSHSVTRAIIFFADLFTAGQNSLDFPQIDDHCPAINTSHLA